MYHIEIAGHKTAFSAIRTIRTMYRFNVLNLARDFVCVATHARKNALSRAGLVIPESRELNCPVDMLHPRFIGM